MSAAKRKLEYGDYQTPATLAAKACRVLVKLGVKAGAVLEPTCGLGSFLLAGVDGLKGVRVARGFDINRSYVGEARNLLKKAHGGAAVHIEEGNFFEIDWREVVASLPEPLVVLGNPPWVTNAALGSVGSQNVPVKSNFQKRGGMDAVTGKSNFDISEYMLIRLSEALQGKDATLAMLCKTAVARKVMGYCWKRDLEMGDCHVFPIDAGREFGAAVDACLFVASFNGRGKDRSCIVHEDFDVASRRSHIGYRDGLLIADIELYEKWRFLRGGSCIVWRSGVKHDCARVMEFREVNGEMVNGLGEKAELEDTFLYPLLKSSAVAGSEKAGRRWVLVTQRGVGEDTSVIRNMAQKTWKYLLRHGEWLDKRASIIYRKRPRFSMFGVGEYSFAPWKVVISGFYKKLDFKVIGPVDGKPVMLDDTAYFLSCQSEGEARGLAEVLNSTAAREFLSSLIFWDAKRPVTVEVLSELNIERVAAYLGKEGVGCQGEETGSKEFQGELFVGAAG